MRTWKPAPPPCWETRFGSGGAQLLIRYLLSWYHAKPSLTQEMQWTLYPTSLHGSLSPSETSSSLWVWNQWQMQLMSQQLTVVNEHNKAPQILYELYLLLFCCLISLVSFSTILINITICMCRSLPHYSKHMHTPIRAVQLDVSVITQCNILLGLTYNYNETTNIYL